MLNTFRIVTERNGQERIGLWTRIFAASATLRPTSPRLMWEVTEQDALDVLGNGCR